MEEASTEHEQGERKLKGTEFNRENNTINIQRPRRSTANYSMNYYSTGCQAPAKTQAGNRRFNNNRNNNNNNNNNGNKLPSRSKEESTNRG